MARTATSTGHMNVSIVEQSSPTTRLAESSFREALHWARGVLDDPITASVYASGMAVADLCAIKEALGGSP